MIDYAAAHAAIYDRAATSSAGAPLRLLLGSSDSLFGQHLLGRMTDGDRARPAVPWLVYAPLPVAGESGQMRQISASFWAYVAPGAGPRRLLQIAAALESLYGYSAAQAIPGGRLRVDYIGRPFPDSALGLDGLEIRVSWSRRG